MGKLISLLASVIISVIVSVLSYYISISSSIRDSILFGLLSFFVTQVAIISVKIVQISKDIIKIKAILASERREKFKNNFDYYWKFCFDKASAGIYTLISENCIKIPHSEIQRFWQRAITNTDIKWECTHYFKVHQDVNFWADAGFELQGSIGKKFGLSVRRLFIFDKQEDIVNNALEHMKWQQNIGIEIKILILKNKERWSNYPSFQKTLGTIDMAIIDDSYLISFMLEKNTISKKKHHSLNYAFFYSDKEKVKKAQEFYKDMWNNSETISIVEDRITENKGDLPVTHSLPQA
jgi:hypothetical protein